MVKGMQNLKETIIKFELPNKVVFRKAHVQNPDVSKLINTLSYNKQHHVHNFIAFLSKSNSIEFHEVQSTVSDERYRGHISMSMSRSGWTTAHNNQPSIVYFTLF